MSGSLVFVDDAFVRHTVNNRHGFGIGRSGAFFIAIIDSGNYFFDVGANHRSQTSIMVAALSCLSGAFLRLG